MAVHDWSRVSAGIFHDLHGSWIIHLKETLNDGLLPADCYALSEQDIGPMGVDVLTLEASGGEESESDERPSGEEETPGGVLIAPPQVQITMRTERPLKGRRNVTIRHTSDDRILAIIEILSPGNKDNRHSLRTFVEKVHAALRKGIHLLLVDLHPPGPRDPQGIHGVLWEAIDDRQPYTQPSDKPLTLVAYQCNRGITAHIQPLAVGETMIDMPLYLDPDGYIKVPLQQTYQQAYKGVPRRWRRVLEAAGS